MTQRVKGRNLMVFLKDAQGQYHSIAYATNHNLNLNRDTADISDKDTAEFGAIEPGQIHWSIDAEHTFSKTAGENLIDTIIAGTEVELKWAIKAEDNQTVPEGGWTPATGSYSGKAYVTSVQVGAPVDGKATCSVTFTGNGAFTPDA